MSKPTFFILATLGFALATLAIGIRGVENWQPYEYTIYFLMLGWATHIAYQRYVQPTAG